MILVTKPFLPPMEEYNKMLEGIWEREWLTNNGPLLKEFEQKVGAKLRVNQLMAVTNGTISLQFALRALDVRGDVITTPFSYVATTSAISWEHMNPVFADIDPDTFNINPDAIENCITAETTAIVATHVFGVPCDVAAIQSIAERHNLKVIYDAAHAFGVYINDQSVLSFGDMSSLSFHATKLFHTVEGGALAGTNAELFEHIRYLRNFGHAGPVSFKGIGVNGKMSEVHAAMGLVNLRYIDDIIRKRKEQYLLYIELLGDAALQFQHVPETVTYNYSYMPVLFESAEVTRDVVRELNNNDIMPRRYFYPLLSTLPYVTQADVPVAASVAERILCLPLYHDLSDADIERICKLIIATI